ncbi:MAG: hypothetical protein HY320_09720 [Armatimonadetes bacterium]|nr:hypothetical protein [Armatimonadota bacterium]
MSRISIAVAALTIGLAAPAWSQTAPSAPGQPVVITVVEFQRLQESRIPSQEMAAVCQCAHASGRSVEDILALHQRGLTWSQICADLNVPASTLQGPVLVAIPMEQMIMARPAERVGAERIEITPGTPMPAATLSPYPSYERKLPDKVWSRAYRLTPADYVRFRAGGLTRREVFFIANAAAITGERPEDIAQMFYRGMPPRWIAETLQVMPWRLDKVLPEWRTPEWAAAVGERGPINRDDLGFFE